MQNLETTQELQGLSFPGVTFTEAGLDLPDNLPYAEWLHIGMVLGKLDQGLQWARGRHLEYGKDHYPDRYSQMLEATDYSGKQSLYNISRVYREFPKPEDRFEGLSFSHHQELTNIRAEYRPALAERAVAEGLSTYQLRQQIEHEKAIVGLLDAPFEVETPDDFLAKWQANLYHTVAHCASPQATIEALCDPTVEGSGRVLGIILSRRKAALARGKSNG